MGHGKLQDDIRNYLACHKISQEYASQLTKEQKADISRRIDDAVKQSENSLVAAYSILAKYSVKKGVERLIIKQFKDSLDTQINNVIFSTLKEDEWLLDSLGLNTLKTNNLFPSPERSIKVKDIYEAFLRFDDKPMITGQESVAKSILKYCFNGEYCIATGEPGNFTKFFFKEQVPFFDVNDLTYWLVDKTLKPQSVEPLANYNKKTDEPIGINEAVQNINSTTKPDICAAKRFKSITVSGKIPLERYTELFNYFITPFAMNGNKIDIEVKFKIKSIESSPIDESKQQYKSAKEAAKQLNLNFDEEV